jgi:hypothetical protein
MESLNSGGAGRGSGQPYTAIFVTPPSLRRAPVAALSLLFRTGKLAIRTELVLIGFVQSSY